MNLTTSWGAPPAVPALPKKGFEFDLEGLRGFAAILVVWCHAVGFPHFLDPHYTPRSVLAFQPPAHLCVLVFFVLSGYVIGLSTRSSLRWATAAAYLRKRLLRIYPIYFLSLLLALVVARHAYPWATVAGNFTFLQVVGTDVISENAVSWSLQYEILFYLLFIPISIFEVNALLCVGVCLAVGMANTYLFPTNALLSSYAFGYAFWCCGLAIANYSARFAHLKYSYALLTSFLLLLLSLKNFNILHNAFTILFGNTFVYLPGLDTYKTMISLDDFGYLPYCLVAILLFTHKAFLFSKYILPLLFLLPLFKFPYLINYWSSVDKTVYVMPIVCYLLAGVIFLTKPVFLEALGRKLLYGLIKIGSISYGLYIVHFPILTAFNRIDSFSGSRQTYWVRFVLFMAVCLAAAYFLEKKVQPLVRTAFKGLGGAKGVGLPVGAATT